MARTSVFGEVGLPSTNPGRLELEDFHRNSSFLVFKNHGITEKKKCKSLIQWFEYIPSSHLIFILLFFPLTAFMLIPS